MIAPVTTNTTVTLAPGSTTTLLLNGCLVPQQSSEGLSVVSDIFNRFIHGEDSNVSVHGAGAGPSDVSLREVVDLFVVLISPLGHLAQRGYQDAANRHCSSQPWSSKHHQVY